MFIYEQRYAKQAPQSNLVKCKVAFRLHSLFAIACFGRWLEVEISAPFLQINTICH